MSSELSNTNTTKTSMGSYALMPSIYVGVNMINNARYFKNPINPLGKDAKAIKDLINSSNLDTFQKAQFSSESFEAIRSAKIKAAKAQKLSSGKLPLKDRFLNLFRKNKVTGADIINKKKLANAQANYEKITKATDAKDLQKILEGLDEGYGNSMNFIRNIKSGQGAVKSFGSQVVSNFKKEFSFAKGNRFNAGFNVAMTALQFIPNVIQKVVPAFKNNGFKAGMTELGQTVVQAGADLVGYAAGGAVGRTIGAAIGTIAGPVGTFIGGLVGDMVGSMFVGSKVCGVVEKITNKDDFKNTGNIELASENEIAQQAAQAQMPIEATSAQNTQEAISTTEQLDSNNINLNTKYANVPSREEIKRMAYAQAFPKNTPKNSMMNSYFA